MGFLNKACPETSFWIGGIIRGVSFKLCTSSFYEFKIHWTGFFPTFKENFCESTVSWNMTYARFALNMHTLNLDDRLAMQKRKIKMWHGNLVFWHWKGKNWNKKSISVWFNFFKAINSSTNDIDEGQKCKNTFNNNKVV